MRSTGIVRRIDELGRVVIPMEARRVMHLSEGDPMEVLIDMENGEIILRKFKQEETFQDAVNDMKKHVENDKDLKSKAVLLEKLEEIESILKG
jgi:transcriptional pleiotropic regulator of transition state genes